MTGTLVFWKGSEVRQREAQSYQYLNDKFEELHITSVHATDEEALEYFSFIQTWFINEVVKYVVARRYDGEKKLLPFTFDNQSGEVIPFEYPA